MILAIVYTSGTIKVKTKRSKSSQCQALLAKTTLDFQTLPAAATRFFLKSETRMKRKTPAPQIKMRGPGQINDNQYVGVVYFSST